MTVSDQARTEQVKWLTKLGMTFVDVRVFLHNGRCIIEAHVNDPLTIEETIKMSSNAWRAAVFPFDGKWVLLNKSGRRREYSSKEAAEMVAIHNG